MKSVEPLKDTDLHNGKFEQNAKKKLKNRSLDATISTDNFTDYKEQINAKLF